MPKTKASELPVDTSVSAEGMADDSFASVAILGLASLDALSEQVQTPMDPRRFRGNLWLSGLEPFQELEMVGQTLRIGTAELEIRDRIDRCRVRYNRAARRRPGSLAGFGRGSRVPGAARDQRQDREALK